MSFTTLASLPAKEIFGGSNSARDRILTRHIAFCGNRLAARIDHELRCFLRTFQIDVSNRNTGATAGELQCDSSANVAARANDQCALPFKSEHFQRSPSTWQISYY